MPTSSGVQVWIEVDGLPLTEYQIEQTGNRMTCYIASQEGKKFTVRYRNVAQNMTGLRGNIYLDGIFAGSGILLPTDVHTASISGQTRMQGLESPFMFSRLKTTDDEDEACTDERRIRDLATVKVGMEWVTILRQEEWRPPSNALSESIGKPIYERSKKASAHCTTLGEIEFVRPKNWYTTQRISGLDTVEFVFQYAPLDWLKAEGLVPVPPSAGSSTGNGKKRQFSGQDNESDLELLDPEEVAVYRRLKEKMANRNNAKKPKGVKQEPQSFSTRLRNEPPEVIDLTGE